MAKARCGCDLSAGKSCLYSPPIMSRKFLPAHPNLLRRRRGRSTPPSLVLNLMSRSSPGAPRAPRGGALMRRCLRASDPFIVAQIILQVSSAIKLLVYTLSRASDENLPWPLFTDAWYAAARHIVLGPTAAEDRALTNDLARLRAAANWVVLPSRPGVRSRYRQKLASYLAKPGAGSLAEMIANRKPDGDESPLDQVTQWLFAFDGGGMTVFRALAVLSTSNLNDHIAIDLQAWRQGRTDLPFLRSAFLDTVRLWPTTPVLLRQATRETSIGNCRVPHEASLAIYLPFFHRDGERVATADRFAPEFWRGRDPADAAPFVPFSAGPAACPGRHVVSLVGSLWLAALLQRGVVNLLSPSLSGPPAPLPASLNPFTLRFSLSTAEMTRGSR